MMLLKACRLDGEPSGLLNFFRLMMPGVSKNTAWVVGAAPISGPTNARPNTFCRVVCGFGDTMEILAPTSALTSDDFPALGTPRTQICPLLMMPVSLTSSTEAMVSSPSSNSSASSGSSGLSFFASRAEPISRSSLIMASSSEAGPESASSASSSGARRGARRGAGLASASLRPRAARKWTLCARQRTASKHTTAPHMPA
mmetsp:Transcript_161795/g.519019  ORF Transcript_161795/g.519019 Transcript_161795/m.519019 type:complete len:200 (+) Transcript_161795:625-1224(+)